jgi:hypothetical protein
MTTSSTPTEKDWYTIIELATMIHKSRKTIWNWIKTKQLRSERCGAQHRIRHVDWAETLAIFNNK